jgi:hypothetical protein
MMALRVSWTASLDPVADCELMVAAEEPEPLDTKLLPVVERGRLVGTECLI